MLATARPRNLIAFFDGQNLFHAAKQAFGHSAPNYAPKRLALALVQQLGYRLIETRFYTGIPALRDDPGWHAFWAERLASMSRRGIVTFSRPLRFHDQMMLSPQGELIRARVGREKGIDVRIALDMVRVARLEDVDALLIFSQDQDLSEAVDEVRAVAHEHNRRIEVLCAFPLSRWSKNRRGINGTRWIPISRATYDACIDQV
jgi:uncharacterized LabA/DUF88 family protein